VQEERQRVADERERFLALNDRVFALYGEGRLAEALHVVDEESDGLPRWRSRTTYWRACLLGALGRPDESLAALRSGLDAGLWWRPDWLTTDQDLEPLWDLSDFAEIVSSSERRQAAANTGRPERPEVRIFPPAGEPRGLLVALHMYGVTADESASYWRAATEEGLAVAVPESTRIQADGLPCWDDEEAVRRDVALAIEEARTLTPGADDLILAGASQGGMRAIEMTLRGEPGNARAFIGVVAGLADLDLLEETARAAARRGVRGWLLTGDRDAAQQAVELLHAQLRDAGLDCRIDVIPGLGHTFPQDFGVRLKAALPFLAGG
jgi:dienelactone hydrolase